MAIQFEKAKREKIWAKVLLAGPSGSGKTYTALRMATGIANKMGKRIAAVDTENGRIRYYANEFDFDDITFAPPHTPERYIELINAAVDAGYGVLVIDSITHEWDYCLEVHGKMPGNSYTNWSKITPRHDAFTEAMLQSSIHVICTVRGKDEYVIEEKNGKQIPKKVGLGYKQRDNVEYNYSVTFNLDQTNHVAEATKDNTHIFENKYEMLTEKDGEALYKWANSSKVEPKKPAPVKTQEEEMVDELDVLKKEIVRLGEEKIADGVESDTVYQIIANHNNKRKNPNSIKDIDSAKAIIEEIKNISKGEEISE